LGLRDPISRRIPPVMSASRNIGIVTSSLILVALGCGDDSEPGPDHADPSSVGDPCTADREDERPAGGVSVVFDESVEGCSSGLCAFHADADEDEGGLCTCDCSKGGCACPTDFRCVQFIDDQAYCLDEEVADRWML
jgi:hypothetical protein